MKKNVCLEKVDLNDGGGAVDCSPHVCCNSVSVVPKCSACVSYSFAM